MYKVLIIIGVIICLIGIVCLFLGKEKWVSYASFLLGVVVFIIGSVGSVDNASAGETLGEGTEEDKTTIIGEDPDSSQKTEKTEDDGHEEEYQESESSRVSISDIRTIGDDVFYKARGAVEDIWGNIYTDYKSFVIWSNDEENPYVEYVTNGEYDYLEGVLFVDSETNENDTFKMIVYADKNQVYESPIIKKRNKPEEFHAEITGADIVKVEFIQVSGHAGMDTGWYTETRGYIANVFFVNE